MTIKRLNYFTGQFLEAADFKAEQDYHIDMRRRGNRALYFSAGILDGFVVTQTKDPSTQEIIDPTEIVISRGIGIDIEGKELVITEPMTVKLPLNITHPSVLVALSHLDKPMDSKTVEDTVIIDGVPTTTFITEATRQQEEVVVTFEYEGAVPAKAIVIAEIYITPDGKLLEPILSYKHQLANVRFPNNVIVGQGGNNGVLKTRNIDGKSYGALPAGDDNGHLYLNGQTGKDVFLGFEGAAKSSLYVSGNAGIGTNAPKAKLQVAGGAIMPEVGNSPDAGIQFPSNPGGGSGDEAFIRYYREAGETTKFMIGTNDKPDDSIGFLQAGTERMTVYNGNVGVGTTTPKSKLSVVGTDAKEIDGAAQSSTFRISAGSLGTAAGSALSLASIGFHSGTGNDTSSNNTSLGIRARRSAEGVNWQTAAIGLGIDVDGVAQVQGASLWLHPFPARVGICTSDPQATLHVNGDALIAGANPIRFTSGYSHFPDLKTGSTPPYVVTNHAEISNDTEDYKALMIVGNRSADSTERRVLVQDRLVVDGVLEVTSDALLTGNMIINNVNPASNLGFINTLTAANIVKAWGLIKTGQFLEVIEGFNIEGVSFSGSSGSVAINLKEKISGGICMTGNAHDDGGFVSLQSNSSGAIIASGYFVRPNPTRVDRLDWIADTHYFSFIVMGRQ